MARGIELSEVAIALEDKTLAATLALPSKVRALVLFAHGSGSSRFSPRNRAVAQRLEAAGLATLLLDLLTAEEEEVDRHTAELRFDIPMLAGRLAAATDWVRRASLGSLPLGYFGASTGAAAALLAEGRSPGLVQAIVSRGGRPDLADPVLDRVQAPTLLIVGGADSLVLDLNRRALAHLRAPARLEVVPGATHLFEEPGTLDRVASLATAWFLHHLAGAPAVAAAEAAGRT